MSFFKTMVSLSVAASLVTGSLVFAGQAEFKDTPELRLVESVMSFSGEQRPSDFFNQAFHQYLNDPSRDPEKANENLIQALNTLGLTDARYNSELREALVVVAQDIRDHKEQFSQADEKQRAQALKRLVEPLAEVIEPTGNLYSATTDPGNCKREEKLYIGSFLVGFAAMGGAAFPGSSAVIENISLTTIFLSVVEIFHSAHILNTKCH
jgi:hypothetical protein